MERILHVVTYMGRGGIETMLMNYYRNIDREKIQFDFLVHRDFRADYDDEIEALGGKIYRIPPMNPVSSIYRKALLDFFKKNKYKVVHCHLNYMSGVVLAVAKKCGVPVRIAHAHTSSMNPGWKQYVKRLCKYLIPVTATNLIACSTDAGRSVFGNVNFNIIANAINAEKFRFSKEVREKKRLELGLNECFTVMHIGRFVYPKNHDFLIEVFKELLQIVPDAKLVLVGDGELRNEIEEKIQQLPINSVQLLGTRNDINELLQAADIFAFPSRFEGMPVTMIEAQAAGLPCIMSDTITKECIVTDLVTEIPIVDPKRWVKAILEKKNMNHKDCRVEIKTSGYDISVASDKLVHFYLYGEEL